MNLRPTFCANLGALRRNGRRPLGGVVLTDYWKAVEGAKRADLFPIYLRARDDWTGYDLAALSGLDVLLHVHEPDQGRIDALIEHVLAFAPRSLRLSTPYGSEVIRGKTEALAEFLRWWGTRYVLATQPVREAA